MDQSSIRFDRLRTLFIFLSALKPEQMNMNSICQNREDVNFDLVKAGDAKECGAIGCAMGWAGLMPEFRKEGLKFTRKGWIKLNGEVQEFAAAAAEFFGLTIEQAEHLFGVQRSIEFALTHQATFQLRCQTLFAMCNEPL